MHGMATVLTRADLDALPDDGRRHELLDGAIFVTPSPGFAHQSVVANLLVLLHGATVGTDLVVFGGPFDVVLSDTTVVVPDLLIAPRAQFTSADLPGAPLLAVEVCSRSTAAVDAIIKRDLYQRAGVASYWLIDPVEPAITVLELVAGEYQRVAHAVGAQAIDVTTPVPLRLSPAELLRV